MSEPLWDWERIDVEMEKAYKAHGDTYQFLWVRELLRQMSDSYEGRLDTESRRMKQRFWDMAERDQRIGALENELAKLQAQLSEAQGRK